MNEHQEPRRARTTLVSLFGVRFAPIGKEREVGETGATAQSPVGGKAGRKLLKTGKLEMYQFGAKLPAFRQATDWPKWETLWASGRKICDPCSRHADCARSI
jgi:hypothetical protein